MTSIRGKTVLITGGTGGIGRQTARGLAHLGARVLMVGRDPERGRTAVTALRSETGNDRLHFLAGDVTRQRDLHRLAGEVNDRHHSLDVLINNAGVTTAGRTLTEDGAETTFAANVLAPYLLTHLLLPALARAAPARVVNITGGIPRGRIDLGNLQGERSFVGLAHYNQTKLALMAMSHTFAERLRGSGTTLNVAYPGHAYTAMNRGLTADAYPRAARPVVPLLRLLLPVLYGQRALVRASRSSVRLASSPDVADLHGTYLDSGCRRTPWPAAVLDRRNRDTIWTLCEKLTTR